MNNIANVADLSVKALFPTPLVIAALHDSEATELNREIYDVVLKKRHENDGVHFSNQGGWQSDNKLVEWGGPAVAKVLQVATDLLAQLTIRSEGSRFEKVAVQWRINGWANVNRKGHGNVIHCHPGAFWSAVYYVQVEPEADNEVKGGELELLDPRGIMPILYCPALHMGIKGYVNAGRSELHRPVPGQLLIFPSWLPHAVTPYMGEGTRVSLAFNFSV